MGRPLSSAWVWVGLSITVLAGCNASTTPVVTTAASSAASGPAATAQVDPTPTASAPPVVSAEETVPAATATPVELRQKGYHGFPQAQSAVLCDTPDLRVSVCCDGQRLFVQAILWNDDDDSVGKSEDGREIGDWSQLVLDLDADQKNTPQVDRSYALNPWPSLPGLRYTVVVSENGTTGLLPDSLGRGAIEYVKDISGRRTRVDSYLIPLDEIKRAPGDEFRLAYWASSVLPKLTVNSVAFESPGAYYSFSLPMDKFHSLTLAAITGEIDAEQVPDPRSEQSPEPERIVATPPLDEAPPEVVAADWLNTDAPQSLADLKGNVVLIEFWATWCGPCVAGIPHLNELQTRFRDRGLRILSLTDQDRETVESFQKKTREPIEYTVGLGSQSFKAYGVTGIPHAFVVARDGKLLWHGHPASAECEAKIAEALEPE